MSPIVSKLKVKRSTVKVTKCRITEAYNAPYTNQTDGYNLLDCRNDCILHTAQVIEAVRFHFYRATV